VNAIAPIVRDRTIVCDRTIARWSLQELSLGSPEALNPVLARLDALVVELEAGRCRLSSDVPVADFLELLHTQERIRDLSAQLGAYAYLLYAGNTLDSAALSLRGRIEQVLTDADNRGLFFGLWFKSLTDEGAAPYIAAAGDLSTYLQSLRRFKPYTLSESEEKIISLKDLNGCQAMEELYEIITTAFTFNLEVGGQQKHLTRDGLAQYYHHPSADVREATYRELYRVYGEQRTVLARIYTALVRDWHTDVVQLRGYASPISARNLVNNLPDAVVDTLLEVCHRNAGLFQRYFRLKARLLRMDRLRRCDIYAPVTRADRSIEFNAAVPIVLDSFRAFSPDVARAAERILDLGHLDAEVRPGKRGGAFCYSVTPDFAPWVLVNYTGRIRDVTVLAHELGHAVHTVLASEHSVLTFRAPTPLAETASVFAEMLVTDRLLQEESDPAVQRDLLMTILDDAYATVQRQAFLSIFERDAHAMMAAGCTSDELSAHYLQNLAEQFGDAVDVDDQFAWEWITVPHIFNSPFYTYAYAFGQLLVLALYQRYLSERKAFVPGYLRLLSYGGSAEPQAILREAGLDITSADFWQGGFDVLRAKLERLEQITGGPQ
jgi:oligoendopeptidase F